MGQNRAQDYHNKNSKYTLKKSVVHFIGTVMSNEAIRCYLHYRSKLFESCLLLPWTSKCCFIFSRKKCTCNLRRSHCPRKCEFHANRRPIWFVRRSLFQEAQMKMKRRNRNTRNWTQRHMKHVYGTRNLVGISDVGVYEILNIWSMRKTFSIRNSSGNESIRFFGAVH